MMNVVGENCSLRIGTCGSEERNVIVSLSRLWNNNDGGLLVHSLEQLDNITYLDAVIREILRYAPTVLGTVRTLTCDDQLPDNGFQLRKGDTVFISYVSLSRDKRYWSDRYDLNEFHPERFLDDPEGKNNPAAWIPFGGGHRICMGQDLAKFELKIICARLMQFVIFVDGGSEVNAGGFDVTDTNRPRKIGVKVHFQ